MKGRLPQKRIVLIFMLTALLSIFYFEYKGYKSDGYFNQRYTIIEMLPEKEKKEVWRKINQPYDKELVLFDTSFPLMNNHKSTFSDIFEVKHDLRSNEYFTHFPGPAFTHLINLARNCSVIPEMYKDITREKFPACSSLSLEKDSWGRDYKMKFDLKAGEICIKSLGRNSWIPWDDIVGCLYEKDNLDAYKLLEKACHSTGIECVQNNSWR